MTTLIASTMLDFRDVTSGWHVAGASVGFDGGPIVLAAEKPIKYLTKRVNRYRVLSVSDGKLATVDLPETTEAYHSAEPLSAGRSLVPGVQHFENGSYKLAYLRAAPSLLRSHVVLRGR